MPLLIPLNKINLDKLSIIFTWDDNLSRHITDIAPLFSKNGVRCTFYVVSNEKYFTSKYSNGYHNLAKDGFEIGSHGCFHKHMTSLSPEEVDFEFRNSAHEINKYIKKYPITFAFPHHDANDYLVSKAREYYLETRNTLHNSRRFSLKTNTSVEDLLKGFKNAIQNQCQIIFSGHSIITDKEFVENKQGEGYEPVRISVLETFLKNIKSFSQDIEVITFAQASMKEYIRANLKYKAKECEFDFHALSYLQKFGIDTKTLLSIL